MNYIKDPETLALTRFLIRPFDSGRPIAVPQGLPPERLAALRGAFEATVKAPEFKAYMESMNSALDPISGEEIRQIIEEIYGTSPAVIDKVRKLLTPSK